MSEKETDAKVVQNTTESDPQVDTKPDAPASDTPEKTDAPATDDPGKEQDEKMIPESQFSKVYARMKSLEEKDAKRERAEQKKKEEQLLSEKKYDEVIAEKERQLEEASTAKETLSETNERLTTMWEELEEQIPEERRALVPESLSPLDKITYVNKNRDFLFGDDKGVKLGAKTQKNDADPALDEDEAKRNRMNELTEKSRNGEYLTFQEKRELAKISRELSSKK